MTAKSKKWWGRYRAPDGRDTRVPLAADRTAAQAMLNDLVRKAERQAAGLEDPCDKHLRRPLKEHIAEYEKYLRNRGRTKNHIATTIQRVRSVANECKFRRITDVSASRVQAFLADLREEGRSMASSNHYLRAMKMFTRWLVRDRRASEDRLAYLSQLNIDVDRRRIRRPVSIDEFTRLLQAAEVGPTLQHLSGPDRAMLYIIASYTGFRRNEIGSVTVRSFDFDSDPPTLTVQAGYSKHRRTDVIPLRQDFARRIRKWIAEKRMGDSDEPLLRVTGKRTAEMIRSDLAAARVKWLEEVLEGETRRKREKSPFLCYVDHQGRYVDFHALRATFITNLSRAGVSPKTAQTLARHSTIDLTMNVYTTIGVLDQVSAIEALPPVPNTATEQGVALSDHRSAG
jgi:integrase